MSTFESLGRSKYLSVVALWRTIHIIAPSHHSLLITCVLIRDRFSCDLFPIQALHSASNVSH